jgi:hypothetical protein
VCVFSYSSTIFDNYVVRFPLNSSNNLVFEAWDWLSSSKRPVVSYIYAPSDLSTASTRSRTCAAFTLIVDAVYLSAKISSLLSEMPVCIS